MEEREPGDRAPIGARALDNAVLGVLPSTVYPRPP